MVHDGPWWSMVFKRIRLKIYVHCRLMTGWCTENDCKDCDFPSQKVAHFVVAKWWPRPATLVEAASRLCFVNLQTLQNPDSCETHFHFTKNRRTAQNEAHTIENEASPEFSRNGSTFQTIHTTGGTYPAIAVGSTFSSISTVRLNY